MPASARIVICWLFTGTSWKRNPQQLAEMLRYIADFKEELSFTVRPAGWHPADEK